MALAVMPAMSLGGGGNRLTRAIGVDVVAAAHPHDFVDIWSKSGQISLISGRDLNHPKLCGAARDRIFLRTALLGCGTAAWNQ
jgi:hypothetical protein